MRVLVLGAGGQLGKDLVPILRAAGHEAVAAGRRMVDVTDREQVLAVISELELDRVVNCAAYTRVDQAELEPAAAFAVNRDGAGVVAQVCAQRSIPLCHISTDFVFSQPPTRPGVPWGVADDPNPKGVYAVSKREGELACEAAGCDLFLVRTSWLYGNRGPNFPLAILRAAAAGRPLRVVSDQVGAPTWTGALAPALAWLIATPDFGRYHLSGGGSASWYEFARAVLQEAKVPAEIRPVTAAEWAAPAPRPTYSVLDNTAFTALGGPGLPPWRASLAAYIEEERQGAVLAATQCG